MPPRFDPRAEIARIRWEFAYIDLKLKRERLRLALRYDESQPRAPAGSSNGGQWVGTGGGASGNGNGDADRPATQTTVHADGTRQELRKSSSSDSSWLAVQDTYRPDGSLAAQTVYNRDNSVIDSQFAPADGSAIWDSRHTIYAPGGRILTVQNTGPVQTLFDTDGHAISQSIWRADGPEPQDLMQPAFLPVVVLAPAGAAAAEAAAAATIELGAILLTWLAARQLRGEQPVMALDAREYERNEPKKLEMTFVGLKSRNDTDHICPMKYKIQKETNDATSEAGSIDEYSPPAVYGTAIHTILKNNMNEKYSQKLLAERSLLKETEDGKGEYGQKNTVRVDVLEDAPNDTVCVYDIKTGKSNLGPKRAAEIASHALKFRKDANRIIVMEMRPGQ